MKIKVLGVFLAICFMLVGCGSEEAQDEGGNATSETKESGKMEIVQHTYYIERNALNEIRIYSYGEAKNSGEEAVSFYSQDVTVKGSDDSIIAVESGGSGFPSTVEPGGISYFETAFTVEGVENEDDISDVTVKLQYSEAFDEYIEVETENVTLRKTEEEIKVTGLLKNPTNEQIDGVEVAAALLDSEGNLVGVLSGYPDGLGAGEETAFELSPLGSFPKELVEKAKSIEVQASKHL